MRRWTIWLASAFGATVIAAASFAVAARRQERPLPSVDVALQRGTFAGMSWAFGVSEPTKDEPCLELAMDAVGPGCGLFPPEIDDLKFFTSSGGDPSGIRTAQGFASERVASVVALAGGRRVGEVYVVDLPQPLAGKTRAVVAFALESELRNDPWVVVAFDARLRVVARAHVP